MLFLLTKINCTDRSAGFENLGLRKKILAVKFKKKMRSDQPTLVNLFFMVLNTGLLLNPALQVRLHNFFSG